MKTWQAVAALSSPSNTQSLPVYSQTVFRSVIEGPKITESIELVEKTQILVLIEEIEYLKKRIKLLESTSWGMI